MNNLPDHKARSRQEVLTLGFSFCIITGGKRPEKLARLIDSIHRQKLPVFEIVVAGILQDPAEGIVYIPLAQEAQSGKVSVMRNHAMRAARYDTIVMSDDDIVIDDGFSEAIAQHGTEFDILCVLMRNPDGSRCWDWATINGPTGHRLMSYEETDDFVYVSSGIFVISRKTLSLGYFDEQKGFCESEDVEFSQRLKAKGARIDLCKSATALHDDPRYTQFDDYPRRIVDFNSWEVIAPGVEARGLYPWDGKVFPLSQSTQFKLNNSGTEAKSFCFTVIPLPAGHFSKPWKCTVSADGQPFAELQHGSHSVWAMIVPPESTRLITLEASDVVLGFCHGAFRDQRAIAACLLKPEVRSPQDGDIELFSTEGKLEFPLLDQAGVSVFAPCMAFGAFPASTRALIRYFEESNIPFGLDLHSVDYWFCKLCFGNASATNQWTSFLKNRKYSGINLVCAEADKVPEGFFKRSQTSRPGFGRHIAVTTATDREDVLRDLKGYHNVMVFHPEDSRALARHAIYASIISPGQFFPKGALSNKRDLPDQRAQAVTILVDSSSDFEPVLDSLAGRYGSQDDVSFVLYVVDSRDTVQKISKRAENHYQLRGDPERLYQTIIWAGTLEAVEELEFIRHSRERINLLSPPLSGWLDQRLSEGQVSAQHKPGAKISPSHLN